MQALRRTPLRQGQRAGIGIVGDTVLHSSEWFRGAAVLSTNLCDCVKIAGGVFAVPGVHVLSGLSLGDVEGFELQAAGRRTADCCLVEVREL